MIALADVLVVITAASAWLVLFWALWGSFVASAGIWEGRWSFSRPVLAWRIRRQRRLRDMHQRCARRALDAGLAEWSYVQERQAYVCNVFARLIARGQL